MEANEEEDRISALPDCLVVEILSRVPIEDAIKTGTLSKRWQHLWTYVPTLIFDNKQHNSSYFHSFVDKTLTHCRQLKLNKFELDMHYDSRFESLLNKWINYAISCNVEELTLMLWYNPCEAEFLRHEFFYINSCFTYLKLEGCIFNPTGAISWKNLRSLYIFMGKLDEDLIKNILSGSPILETLDLGGCYGFRSLDITSKSVKNLVLSGYASCDYMSIDIVEINAPNILYLAIEGNLFLRQLLLLNVSSVVQANLNFTTFGLTKEVDEEEILEGFILKLPRVKVFNIGIFCCEIFSRLESKGFVYPSNVKFPDFTSDGECSGSD